MVSYVYSRVNKANGKFYIGKADNPSVRWKKEDQCNSKRKSALEDAIKKYGSESFDNYIIAKCKNAREAYKVEEELTTICRCIDAQRLYNLTNGGENPPVMYGDDNPMRNPDTAAKFQGDKHPRWKDHARIIKKSIIKGKQRYALRYQGKNIKYSIYPEKLKQYAIKNNLPLREDNYGQ